MNIGIAAASGEIVVRIDGHTVVPEDYVRRCVEALRRSGAECAGGLMTAVGDSFFGRLVASATSGPFGVGDSQFHYADQPMFTESAYMGSWPRDVLVRLGGFDEEMVRNQDDELNYRLRARREVYLDPAIRSSTAAGKPAQLFKQYFQYGYWKVGVFQKHPSMLRARTSSPRSSFCAGPRRRWRSRSSGPGRRASSQGEDSRPWAAGFLAGGALSSRRHGSRPGEPRRPAGGRCPWSSSPSMRPTGPDSRGPGRIPSRWFSHPPPHSPDEGSSSTRAALVFSSACSRAAGATAVLAACRLVRWFPAIPIPGVNVREHPPAAVLFRALAAPRAAVAEGAGGLRPRRAIALAPMLLLSFFTLSG
jgi:hypothetical protein